MTTILPVILSGGSGTRLWPASRSMYPKQLLPLVGEESMIQTTVRRVSDIPGVSDSVLVVSNEDHRFLVAEQLQQIAVDAKIILEPAGRNTAPAIALAAINARSDGEDPILLVLPADHVIEDVASFRRAVEEAAKTAVDGELVTFGVVPTSPETGYGYIKAAADGMAAVPVESFVEKPDFEVAKSYVDGGQHFWNSGMFLFRASAYLDALREHAPEIFEHCEKSMAAAESVDAFIRPGNEAFLASPSDSIDYAVMEKANDVKMLPLDVGWSDVGSWTALHELLQCDDDGNWLQGDVVSHECSDTFVSAESRLVGVAGLTDMVVVETKDAVLVLPRSRSQDVKQLVDKIRRSDRPETDFHRQVYRPWGSFDSLENQDGFQVKRLVVKPGAVLSLQKHAHRAEHWVVVRGRARITLNDDVFDLGVNESTYIAIGDVHRIANPFDEAAHIIEVQCGDYLGEDDIVRLEDNYGREGTSN